MSHREFRLEANGPWPDPAPIVRYGPAPAYRALGLSGCDYPDCIWLNRWDWTNRSAYYHEHVHWFDYQYLNNTDREAIAVRYNWPLELPWFWPAGYPLNGPDPNCERLAWAGVRMYKHPHLYRWLRQLLREAKNRAAT